MNKNIKNNNIQNYINQNFKYNDNQGKKYN